MEESEGSRVVERYGSLERERERDIEGGRRADTESAAAALLNESTRTNTSDLLPFPSLLFLPLSSLPSLSLTFFF